MSDIQEAIEEFPISSYLDQFLRTYTPKGDQQYADCPVCKGRKKLSINLDKKVFHCFKCREGEHGGGTWTGGASLFQMILLLENCTRAQAFRRIFELAGLPEPPRAQREKPQNPYPSGKLVPLQKANPNGKAVNLLSQRGVAHLIPHCYVAVTGDHAHRVVIPCLYKGRTLATECKATYASQVPKSLYWPPGFQTDKTVYTSLFWDAEDSSCVVTESILDAETFHEKKNAVGIYGCSFGPAKTNALLELGVDTLYWMLDAGTLDKTANHIRQYAMPFFTNYVIPLQGKEDPNALGRSEAVRRVDDSAIHLEDEWDIWKVVSHEF